MTDLTVHLILQMFQHNDIIVFCEDGQSEELVAQESCHKKGFIYEDWIQNVSLLCT